MQVTITANALKSMLPGFAKVLSSRNHIPALECARIEKAASGEVTLTVTNLDEALAYTLPAETQPAEIEPGAFLCPVTELKAAANGLEKDDTVTLVPDGDAKVRITALTGGQAITREVESMSVAEFPSTSLGNAKLKPCDTATFMAAYKVAACAASKDESRHQLRCVFADAKESAMIGTDGRRMMRAALPDMPLKQSLLIPPTKVLANGILGVTEGFAGGMVTNTGTSYLEIRGGPWSYCVRCGEGNYPNYKQVIPNDSPSEICYHFAEADIPLLQRAVKQLRDNAIGSITLLVHAEGITLLGGKPNALGEFANVTLPNSRAENGHAMHAVNPDFLLDAINAGYLHVRAPSDVSPLKFRPTPDETCGVYVLMPMREQSKGMTAFAHKLFPNSVPAPETASATEEQPANVPETTVPETNSNPNKEETETMKKNPTTTAEVESAATDETAGTAEAVVPPVMQFPTSGADPLQELLAELNAAQDTALDTLNRLKAIRQKARNVERHYRGKAKEIEAKSQLIAKFQKAVSL